MKITLAALENYEDAEIYSFVKTKDKIVHSRAVFPSLSRVK